MRIANVFLIALAAGSLLGACGGDGGSGATSTTAPDATQPTQTTGATAEGTTGDQPASPTAAASQVLVLVGQPQHTAAAVSLLRGFEARVNAVPGPNDVVLFTVSAVDGPMPQTREQIEALRGRSYGPSAILLVQTDQSTDPEIHTLVINETRELLVNNGLPNASNLAVIVGEDPNLALLLRGLAASG